jgi:hypothetical protein
VPNVATKPASDERGHRRQNYAFIALALVALALRIAPQWDLPLSLTVLPVDSSEYLELADGIRHGCGFARLTGGVCQQPEILRTPGYPLLLAAIPGLHGPLILQGLMSGLICLLVARWVRRAWSFSAALVAEVLVAFDLPSLAMANVIMSDLLFQLVLLLAVVPPLLVVSRRTRNWIVVTILAAAAAAYAIMTRPIALMLPFAMPIPFLFMPTLERRRRLALAAIAFVLPFLVMGAWVVRNYRVAGYAGLSTIGTINLYFYRAANLEARMNGADFVQVQKVFGARLGQSYVQVLTSPAQSPKLLHEMNTIGRSVLLSHPWEAAKATIQATLYMAIVPDRTMLARVLGLVGGYEHLRVGLNAGAPSATRVRGEFRRVLQSPTLVALLALQVLLTVVLWAGVGSAMFRCLRGSACYRIWTLYLTGVALLFIVLAAGGEASVRFRVPVVPLLAVVAALGYFPQSTDDALLA